MRKSKRDGERERGSEMSVRGLWGPYYKWYVGLLFVEIFSIFRLCLILEDDKKW